MKKLNYLIELLKKVANPENDSRKLGKVFINQIECYKNELIRKFMNNKIQDNRKQFEDSLIYIPNNVNTNLNYCRYIIKNCLIWTNWLIISIKFRICMEILIVFSKFLIIIKKINF